MSSEEARATEPMSGIRLRPASSYGVRVSQMTVYTLTVYEAGSLFAVETVTLQSSAATMAAIPGLLAKHPGCESVKVHAGGTYLFSVNCKGERLPD